MRFYFSVCSTEFYQMKYLEFLLEHYSQLNLPYPFPIAYSFMVSPILMRRESILCFNEEDEVVGALGYIYGTGKGNYEDRHIVQIQLVFLLEKYRKTSLFIKGLQFLLQSIDQLNREVQELRFLAPAADDLRRLLAKMADRTASHATEYGPIDEYRASFLAWRTYASKFRRESYL